MTDDDRFRRTPKRAGFCAPERLPRGPEGRALCRECGKEVPMGRRTFCGDACVDAWKITTDPGHAAALALARDHGVCSSCGLDCVALSRELQELHLQHYYSEIGTTLCRLVPWTLQGGHQRCQHASCLSLEAQGRNLHEMPIRDPVRDRMVELGLKPTHHQLKRRLWELDHVVPVVEGGGSCGLENLRTLCWRCHAAETRELARRRAEARKKRKEANP